jgi:hypothetical protein
MSPSKSQPDLSEFDALSPRAVSRCGIAKVTLEPEQRAKLNAAMAADRISAATIALWLDKRGFSVSGQVVRRHRAGECSC